MKRTLLGAALALLMGLSASAQPFDVTIDPVDFDRWMYPFNGTPGTRNAAPTFGAVSEPDFDNKDGQLVIAVDTAAAGIPTGQGPSEYNQIVVRVTATHSTPSFAYDPTYDSWQTYLDPGDPQHVPDSDPGQPIEIYGVGFRNGYAPPLSFGGPSAGPPDFEEGERFCETCSPPTVSGPTDRNIYPLGFGTPDPEDDVSNNVMRYLPLTGGGFDTTPWAIGTSTSGLAPGDPVPTGTLNTSAGETFEFVIDGSDPDVDAYLRESLDAGVLEFTIVSMHGAEQGQSTANPNFYAKESADSAAIPPSVEITFQLPEPGAGLGLAAGGLALALLNRRRRPFTSEVA